MVFLNVKKSHIVDGFIKFLFIAFVSVVVSSCDLAANYTKTDRSSNMEFQDFRDGLADRSVEIDGDSASKASTASIPDLQPYITTTPNSIKSAPLVSISVNQSVPLRDILYELAEQAEYDIELDPNIRGSIIFTARNKPFDLVIERISKMAGLRYKFEDNFLRIELDKPYVKTYKVSYLSFIRSNDGAVNTTVSVASAGSAKTGGAKTGSSYTASSESVSDFWGELELNLSQIIGGASTRSLKTKKDPKITAAAQNPDVAAVSPQTGEDGETVQAQAPNVVLNVESLPIDDEDNISDNGEGNGFNFSINKQAGLINVFASEKIHSEINDYLTVLRRSVTSQVLVEAKIFEVSLNDEYINGIEWQALSENGKGIIRLLEGTDNLLGTITQPGGTVATISNFGAGYVGSDVGAFVEAISGFGTVRALASPRLTVLNNQSAVLNVATNRVFFELDIDQNKDDVTGDTLLEIDTNIKSIPEGVLINVQPSIDLDNRTLSMFIRPTITRIVGTKSDPSVLFVAGGSGIVSEIPELNVQEIDTVVRVKSGQPIVMGGLLQDRITDTQEGVPVIGEVPLFGALFRKQKDLVSKTELVIFLKATILDSPDDSIHDTDRDLYRTFSGDRRPFKL